MTLPVPLPHLLHFSPRRLRVTAGVVVFGVALAVPFAAPSSVADTGLPLRPASVLGQLEAVERVTPNSPPQTARESRRTVQHRSAPRRLVRLRIPRVVRPARGPVSSSFGWRRHPVSGRSRHHDGADLAVPLGSTVRSVASGVVRSVGRRSGYGLVVEIDHVGALGSAHRRSLYAHLSSTDQRVQQGVRVRRGQPLGTSGGVPGRDGLSTGPHLHFEVRDASGQPLDPAVLLRAGGPRERRVDGSWQVMFSSGREPRPARPRTGPRVQARSTFAPPSPAGSRSRNQEPR